MSYHYYNDNDLFMVEWLVTSIATDELQRGIVDGRSITEVLPDGLNAFRQCHFFAGVGGWPLALRWAGWPEDHPVWTGSCPCPPFSSAAATLSLAVNGERRCKWCGGREPGFIDGPNSVIEWFGCVGCGWYDTRHLWPEFLRLIKVCRPAVVFGEQVSSPLGRQWNAGVYADLEAIGYRVPCDEQGNYELYDLPAAGVGAPHIRQRLFWVGVAHGSRSQSRSQAAAATRHGSTAEPAGWHDCRIVACRDLDKQGRNKLRRVPSPESSVFPLAHGLPRKLGPPLAELGQVGLRAARANRVGRLRGYGNAIVPTLAAEFIRSYMEARKR